MADSKSLDSLIKVDDSTDGFVKLNNSKKYKATKRKIISICRGLTIETKEYLPGKTIEQIESYVKDKNKMERIPYSEISNHLFNLEPNQRVIFLTNVENMLIYSLGKEDSIDSDVAKIVVKIYDHTQLVNYQIENMNDIFVQRIEDAKIDLHSEIKGIEKEYITILGIFAAIVLAFVGTFTFSTSVLNNVTNTNVYKLAVISVVIGFVFYNLIGMLIDFLRDINGKGINNKPEIHNSRRKTVNILLFIIIIVSLIGYGITKISLPEKVYIGSAQEQVQDYQSATGFSDEQTK